jgi:hypothetical protein
MRFLRNNIPRVTKEELLFVAGLAWLGTSGFLVFQGMAHLYSYKTTFFYKLLVSIIIGITSYYLIFRKIIKLYIVRIQKMKTENPNILSFMGVRGYLVLVIMSIISFGIQIYKWIDLDYLFTFQMTMSVPVFLSAVLFFRTWHSTNK